MENLQLAYSSNSITNNLGNYKTLISKDFYTSDGRDYSWISIENKLKKQIKIIKEDIENALKLYQENDEVNNRDKDKDLKKYLLNSMYC